MTTPRGAPELVAAQALPETTVNEQIRHTEAGAGHFIVADNDLTAPPGTCADGASYIPAATATGLWAGKENYIATAVGANAINGWLYHAPKEGYTAYIQDENVKHLCDGSAWAADSSGGATEATASEILVGSSTTKYISPDKFRTATAPATLTSTSNVTAVDFEAGRNFTFTINEDSELGNPTNVQAGDSGLIYIIQDGTGGWTPTFDSNWKAVGDLTADETIGAVNVYSYFARSGTAITLTYLGVEA